MIVLIPSYEPDARLVTLVEELRSTAPGTTIVVVDDGSGPAFEDVFAQAVAAGAELLGYPANRGKGHALKIGFTHVREHHPDESVVCADSDGQHLVRDILRVAERVETAGDAIVIGGRRFTGDVPLRSRFGNAVARVGFRVASGIGLHDTQTGLRGYPASRLEWLGEVGGQRFEYELNTLLAASAARVSIEELEIETVYLQHNASSHFRPIVDSVRVLVPLLSFALVSFASFVIDTLALLTLSALTGSLLWSVIGARVISGGANFLLNRRVVFRSKHTRTMLRDAARYVALALGLLAASYVALAALTGLGVPLIVAKLVADAALYVVSFVVQRRFVFAPTQLLRVITRADVPDVVDGEEAMTSKDSDSFGASPHDRMAA